MSCAELHKKAEKIAMLLCGNSKISNGDHVALIFPPGLELIAAFYACIYTGNVIVKLLNTFRSSIILV